MKTCKTCGTSKPIEQFPTSVRASGTPAPRPHCQACTNEAGREKARIRMERHRQDNPGRSTEIARRWKQNNQQARALDRQVRHLRFKQCTPVWADIEAMKAIYLKAKLMRADGKDVVVDHVIPIKGKLVCGLHVETNLAIISHDENRSKSHSFDVS